LKPSLFTNYILVGRTNTTLKEKLEYIKVVIEKP